MPSCRPTVLIIMDGWALNPDPHGNAVAMAETPVVDRLMSIGHMTLRTCGEDVGLPAGQMGNSEVGHLNLGAGRIVYQNILRIDKAIEGGSFFQNEVLTAAMDSALQKESTLHLIGLVSDGGVHSHQEHLYALIRMAMDRGLKKVRVHAIMDGRDTSPHGGEGYLQSLQEVCHQAGNAEIASVTGRYHTMDRDKRWARTELGYRVVVSGEGEKRNSAVEAIRASYENDVTDEFVLPAVICRDGKPVGQVRDGDSIIFFNFRADRARQLTRAFTEKGFDGFDRGPPPEVHFVSMTRYGEDFDVLYAFPPQHLDKILGEVLSESEIPQFRTAETEKYAHVTYFFNGGEEEPFPLEDRLLVPSPKVPTYDLQPELSARGIADAACERICSGKYGFVLINFANPDMVGHTGVIEAAVKAVEVVDECVGKVLEACHSVGGTALVTADHGNADQMIDPRDGGPFTAHTLFPVPFILVTPEIWEGKPDESPFTLREGEQPGILADVAPTVLDLMGIEHPEEMTGQSKVVARKSAPIQPT